MALLIQIMFIQILISSDTQDKKDKDKKKEQPATFEEMVVEQPTSSIYKTPAYGSPVLLTVKRMDSVKKVGEEGRFYKVQLDKGFGYIYKSAVTEHKKFRPREEEKESKVAKTTTTMAAKGFSPDIEADYKTQNNLEAYYIQLDGDILNAYPHNKSGQDKLYERVHKFQIDGGMAQ